MCWAQCAFSGRCGAGRVQDWTFSVSYAPTCVNICMHERAYAHTHKHAHARTHTHPQNAHTGLHPVPDPTLTSLGLLAFLHGLHSVHATLGRRCCCQGQMQRTHTTRSHPYMHTRAYAYALTHSHTHTYEHPKTHPPPTLTPLAGVLGVLPGLHTLQHLASAAAVRGGGAVQIRTAGGNGGLAGQGRWQCIINRGGRLITNCLKARVCIFEVGWLSLVAAR